MKNLHLCTTQCCISPLFRALSLSLSLTLDNKRTYKRDLVDQQARISEVRFGELPVRLFCNFRQVVVNVNGSLRRIRGHG
ncbi:hypothetical protein X777_10167 [Ooceraea biroi]|uniref:Uncharacterized protein n=1 Tax=Ooceraea biroi TaxID=2015173 RepID=A0A026X2M9_OOCBI|nr:hypothetical protein X777_10167 [Ooceraea biroi]